MVAEPNHCVERRRASRPGQFPFVAPRRLARTAHAGRSATKLLRNQVNRCHTRYETNHVEDRLARFCASRG
jgi:hypothetical protein